MSTKRDYWVNAIDVILADLDIGLTLEQIEAIAEGAVNAADLYGEATGEPGWSGRFAEVQREHDRTVKELRSELDAQISAGHRAVSEVTGIPVDSLDRVQTLSGPRWVAR